LQNLSDSGVKAVYSPDPHDDGEFGFGGDVKVAMLASVASEAQFVGFRFSVFLHVLFSALEDGRALGFRLFLFEKRRFDLFGAKFRSGFALLQQSLWNCGKFRRFRVRHFIKYI